MVLNHTVRNTKTELQQNKMIISKKKIENKMQLYCSWIIILSSEPNKNSAWELLVKYFGIWPFFQWATSLLTLVLIYWISGYFYNKFLSHKGGWMDTKTRIYMIIIDLILNFSLGIYYMNYRNTFIGSLMLQCPVFCSPIFWFIELICFYIYYRYIFYWKK